MARKTRDPVLVDLLDQQQKTFADFERWYAKLKRAFTRLDKLKRKLARLAKKIHGHEHPKEAQ